VLKFLKGLASSKWVSFNNNKGDGEICQRVGKNFSIELFQFVKVIQRMRQPVYEHSDLLPRSVKGMFYN
jgi:hypothetical protein